MKTTIDIADPLLTRAREVAARDGETLRSLIEKGLSKELAERTRKTKPFKLRQVTCGGDGLRPEVAHLSPHELIHLSYEGRGG
ncbi:MAG: DUF2191 domain-containing protein [Pseudomonadota bacterium]|nr:DUF2191 domain-containing protein [Pseudomonadota bacterium]